MVILLSCVGSVVGHLGDRSGNLGTRLTLVSGLRNNEGAQVGTLRDLLSVGLAPLAVADALLGLVKSAGGGVLLLGTVNVCDLKTNGQN